MDSLSNYEQKMKTHLANDTIVNHKEIRKIEHKINVETKAWLEILSVGKDCGQERRSKSNLVSTQNSLPVLYGTAKDHKKAKNATIGPDCRPIMGARVGPNTGLSQIGCKIVKAISQNLEDKLSVKSTEEMLCKFRSYNINRKLENSKKMVASMDIDSFYPSINPVRVAEIARLMWKRSDLKVNINHEKLAMYLGTHMSKAEIENENISEIVFRKAKRKRICKKKIVKK